MNIRSAAFAALVALSAPGIAQAVTITVENNTVNAHADAGNGVGATLLQSGWSFSPVVKTLSASVPSSRSPWELDTGTISPLVSPTSPGFFTVGKNGENLTQVATLNLGKKHTSFSLLWGSPDAYNTLELLLDGIAVAQVTVIPGITTNAPTAKRVGAAFVSITETLFDRVRFTSTSNAFEWASMSATPVPLPAPVMLLLASLAGLGFLSRKRKMIAA